MKKNILRCILFLLITLLLPYTLTKIISQKITLSSIPDPAHITIRDTSDGENKDLSFDEYLLGVIVEDLPITTQYEAIKAQTVIARTYALKNISIQNETKLRHLQTTRTDSSYATYTTTELGLPFCPPSSYEKQLEHKNFSDFLSLCTKAIEETHQEVLLSKDQLITPLYFSSCAGTTRNAKELWGTSIPYLKSVASELDVESPDYLKISVSTIPTVIDALNYAYQNRTLEASDYDHQVYPSLPLDEGNFFEQVQILSRDSAGYVLTVSLGGIVVPGESFANALGLNSSCFYIENYEQTVRIVCNGCGHGIGYSMYGANSLAKEGYSYKDLLTYYYTKVKIQAVKHFG